jgi:hypothetical protein
MRYWAFLDGEVPGSYEPEELSALPGFGETSMVCPSEAAGEERNWRHAGQFPDIVEALRRRQERTPPTPPATGVLDEPKDPNSILNDASTRIFQHVSELMKELENRREERALTQSLQRQVVELKNELLASRERNKYLQDRAELIPGFEERERKLQELTAGLRTELQEREQTAAENGKQIKALSDELEAARRGETGLAEDLKRQTRLAGEISSQLAAKEFTLVKAFGVIRRLEAVLADILPGAVSGIAREVPGYKEAPAPQEAPKPVIETKPEAHPPKLKTVELEDGAVDSHLPPEGEVRPVPAPWQPELKKLAKNLRERLPSKKIRPKTDIRKGDPHPEQPRP